MKILSILLIQLLSLTLHAEGPTHATASETKKEPPLPRIITPENMNCPDGDPVCALKLHIMIVQKAEEFQNKKLSIFKDVEDKKTSLENTLEGLEEQSKRLQRDLSDFAQQKKDLDDQARDLANEANNNQPEQHPQDSPQSPGGAGSGSGSGGGGNEGPKANTESKAFSLPGLELPNPVQANGPGLNINPEGGSMPSSNLGDLSQAGPNLASLDFKAPGRVSGQRGFSPADFAAGRGNIKPFTGTALGALGAAGGAAAQANMPQAPGGGGAPGMGGKGGGGGSAAEAGGFPNPAPEASGETGPSGVNVREMQSGNGTTVVDGGGSSGGDGGSGEDSVSAAARKQLFGFALERGIASEKEKGKSPMAVLLLNGTLAGTCHKENLDRDSALFQLCRKRKHDSQI